MLASLVVVLVVVVSLVVAYPYAQTSQSKPEGVPGLLSPLARSRPSSTSTPQQ